ncbi:MAG: hypothetical protein KGI50_01030 [Patescibacteria group bacterium]|nr:hypothetical protein [Patescibacteria group bacterium]MDE2438065.1 hypothetical protein [Patescibacteria group bacterium]
MAQYRYFVSYAIDRVASSGHGFQVVLSRNDAGLVESVIENTIIMCSGPITSSQDIRDLERTIGASRDAMVSYNVRILSFQLLSKTGEV